MAPKNKAKHERLKGLYFILNLGPGGFSEIPLWLEGVMANGVRIIQVRGKRVNPIKLTVITRQVIQLANRYDASVIVNDFRDVAHDAGAFGVHLGARDSSINKAKQILNRDAIVGVTVRNLEQAKRAIGAGADYIAVGSIFKSPTKPAAPVVGVDVISIIKEEFPKVPLCAIGGINVTNIISVHKAGADMVAVVTTIASSGNPEREAFALSTALTLKLPGKGEEDLDELCIEDLDD